MRLGTTVPKSCPSFHPTRQPSRSAMSTELVPLSHQPSSQPALPALATVDVLTAFLAGRKPTTVRAYQFDLGDFARFLGSPSPTAAVELLLAGTAGAANAL